MLESSILKINSLSKAFGKLQAVHKVTFAVQPGVVTSVIGPNGAGKTTLFNLITGHLKADTVLMKTDEAYPPLECDLSYRLEYNARSDRLTVERVGAMVNRARFKVTGEMGGFRGDLAATLNLQSERLPISELLSLLPPGQRAILDDYTINGSFSLDADLNRDPAADNPDWRYTGSATLNDLEVSSSLFDGRLAVGRCLVDFKPDNLRMNIEQGSFDGQPIKGHLVLDDFENPSVSGELAGGLNLALSISHWFS